MHKKRRNVLSSNDLIALFILGTLLCTGPLVAGTGGAGPFPGPRGRASSDISFSAMEMPFSPDFNDAAWTPDGASMVVAARDRWILRYDADLGIFKNITRPQPFSAPDLNRVAVSKTTGTAIVVGNGGTAILVDLLDDIQPLATQTSNDLWGAAFSPDSSFAFISGDNATLLRYDPANSTVTRMDETVMTGFSSIPSSMSFGDISFSPDGAYALLLSPEGKVFKVMDASITDISDKFAGIGTPLEVAWCPVDSNALIVTGQTSAFIWNDTLQAAITVNGQPDAAIVSVSWRNGTYASMIGQGITTSVLGYSGSFALTDVQHLGAIPPVFVRWRPDGKECILLCADSMQSVVYRYPGVQPSLSLTLSDVTDTSASLNWTYRGTTPPDHFSVFLSSSNSSLFDSPAQNVSSDRLTLSTLTPGKAYFAAVRAVLDTVPPENITSNVVNFTTLAARPVPSPSVPSFSNINSSSVLLSWSWEPGTSGEKLDHFLLYYSSSETSLLQQTPLNAFINTSGTLSKLSASTTYYLMIRVVTASDRTADSPIRNFTTGMFIIPQQVNLTVSGNQIRWKASSTPGASSYEVYFGTLMGSPVGDMDLIGTRSAATGDIAYDLSGQIGTSLREGNTYYFRVRTVHRDGGFSDSDQVSWRYDVAPSPVMGTKIANISYDSVRLTWSRSSASDFGAYVIEYREYLSGSWKVARRITGQDVTSATIGSLSPDTRYQFRIKVQDKAGNSSQYQEWSTHPRTSENILYSVFFAVLYTPEVCIPVSFFLTFISLGVAIGASRGSGRPKRALVAGAFAGGFGLVLLSNILWILGIFEMQLEMKFVLFILPFPIAAAIGATRWAKARARMAREAQEMQRRQAEMAQNELRRRADGVRGSLEATKSRMTAVEAIPKAPSVAPARDIYQRALWAFQTGNILLAEEEVKRCQSSISELESATKDKQTQVAELTKRLEALDGNVRQLIDGWQKYDPAVEMGIPASRIDKTKLDAARSEQDRRIQSAQACAQQAGVSLDKDRLSEAREAAASGEGYVDKLQRSVKDRIALQERIMATGPAIEELSAWAEFDRAGFERMIETAKLALAYDDRRGAEVQQNGIVSDIEKIKEDCKPSIRLAALPSEYQINRFEDFQLTVSNEGNALAQNIELSFEAPADFGPGEEAGMLRIDSLAAKHSQEARLNLCFSKEGKVPVMVTVNYEDHAGNALSMNPMRLTVTVVREGSPQQAVVAPAQPRKGGVIINARPILQGGFFLYKLAVVNHSGLGLADARVLVSYKREILRFHHISPRTLLERFKYLPGEGEREDVLYLGYLDPLKDQEVTAELFFHPYICTETVIEAELCYRDTQGKKLSIDCEPKKFPCYCPTLGSTEAPNPAMLLRFIETAGVKDSRVEPIDTGVSLSSAFEVLKSVINEFGMASVGSDRGRPSPYHAEALFYGEEDGGDGNVLRYAVIGMVSQRQAGASDAHLGGTAEIHVACEARTKVTALLATLAERFSSKLEKQANIKRPVYVDMRDYKTVIKDSIIYKSSIATGGGESQIDGSVIGRSSVGPAISDPKTAQSAAKYQESYKRVKFNDGIVDEEERAFLENLSSMYSIPPEIVQAIERKVDREYEDGAPKPAQPAPRCPRCQASVRAGDVVCSNCGDLLKA